MRQYLELLDAVAREGHFRNDRTGIGATSLFGAPDFRHEMQDGFPLLTTKRIHFRSVLVELIWFLTGQTNVRYLQENGVTIWDEWADKETGELGPVYGKQWRNFGGVDQIADLVKGLINNPYGRRHLVSAWNPPETNASALPPCHYVFQCYVSRYGILDLKMSKRSTDIFLGLPFNIASYALLLLVLSNVTGYKPGKLIISFGDLHLYRNHYEQASLQRTREPFSLPSVTINRKLANPWDLRIEDVELEGYGAHPAISAPVAV